MAAVKVVAVVVPGWETIHSDDPVGAFEPVVRAVSDAVPLVHVRRPGTLLMSARGPARFHGSLEAAIDHLLPICRAAVTVAGSPAPLGIGAAVGQFCATVAGHLSAGSGEPMIVAEDRTADFIGALSARWLALGDADPDHIGILERLGVVDLAAVRALGERAMVDRFGSDGSRMHRLASGEDPDPLVVGGMPGSVSATWRREPDEPDDDRIEATVAAMRPACEEMFARLQADALQCTAVRISVVGDRGARSDRVWHEPHGLSVGCVLDRAGRQMAPAPGRPAVAVTEVTVEAVGVRAASATQGHLWASRGPDVERVVRALSMVRAIDDGSRVGVPRRVGARDVLEMYRTEDATRVDLTDADAAEARVRVGDPWPGALPAPFPATLWSVPMSVEVLDADGAPVGVTGRHELTAAPAVLILAGMRSEVLAHGGPWPLEERWWDPRRRRRTARLQLLVRDRIGEAVHLVHLENGRWWAVARYD